MQKLGKSPNFGVICEIERTKFGVFIIYLFGGKIWCSNKNFRCKFWGQAPRPPGLLVLFVVSYKTVIKDDWLEITRVRNRTVKHLKLSISNYSKDWCNLLWYWLKHFDSISHFGRSFNLVRHQDLRRKAYLLILYLPKSKRKCGLNCL